MIIIIDFDGTDRTLNEKCTEIRSCNSMSKKSEFFINCYKESK